MAKHFYLPSEYLIAHEQVISSTMKPSALNIDRQIESGEKTELALWTTFSIGDFFRAGIVAVTTHRILCCSSISDELVIVSLPFSETIGIGDTQGLILKQMPISCGDVHLVVRASKDYITQIRTAVLSGIEAFPLQNDLHLSPFTLIQDADTNRRVQAIKANHTGERRLSKAEAAHFDKCCNKPMLVERERQIYCLRCGHQF